MSEHLMIGRAMTEEETEVDTFVICGGKARVSLFMISAASWRLEIYDWALIG